MITTILFYISLQIIMVVTFMLLEVSLPKLKDKFMFTVLAVCILYLYSMVSTPDVHWFFFVAFGISFFTSLYISQYLRRK